MKKRLLTIVLCLSMVLTLLPAAALAAEFDDTEGNWADSSIQRWADEGIIEGDGSGSFNPDAGLDRGSAAKVISALMHYSEEADTEQYTDMDPEAWYQPWIAKAVAAGVMKGTDTDNPLMEPKTEVTREMMFVMIARAVGINGEEEMDKEFPDADDTDDWAAPYINALANMGVLNGTEDGTLSPLEDIDRASTMHLLDELIGGYANEDGDTVKIEEGKLTLIVADNVTVEGAATGLPIIVAGECENVDMKSVEGKAVVYVETEKVEIKNAPAGTEVVTEDVSGVTVNGHEMKDVEDYIVPEPAKPTPTPTPSTPTPSKSSTNEAETAVESAWTALVKALETAKLNELVVPAADEEGKYFLTLDCDKISADSAVADNDVLGALLTSIQTAITENFDDSTVTINGVVVYEKGEFNNTELKQALLGVANGFFVKLSEMQQESGVYTYTTITAKVTTPDSNIPTETDEKTVTLAIQLKGEDVAKVQELAKKFAEYLSMKQMDLAAIKSAYGDGDILSNLPAEEKYIVVGVEMPQSVLNALKEHKDKKDAFEQVTVSTALTALGSMNISSILGEDDAPNINSLCGTLNSNANLINKVLGKMTVKVGGKELASKTFNPANDPANGQTEWNKFVSGVAAMFGSDTGSIGATKIGDYALKTENEGIGYYAVPVTVDINLADSMDFTATETVIVILHIPFGAGE